MTEDSIKLKPPTAQHVARRALCLSAVVCRGFIDSGRDPDAGNVLGQIRGWLGRARLIDHLESWEAEIIGDCLGQMDRQRVYQATWAVEGLAILAWALGCG